MTNAQVIESINGRPLLLPDLIKQGLAANDRIKYYLTVLQSASAHAQQPFNTVPDLRTVRESSGVSDAAFDAIVGASRRISDTALIIPGVARIRELLFSDLRLMLDPLRTTASADPHVRDRFEAYGRRLDATIEAAPVCENDQLEIEVIDALTAPGDDSHDSLHRLVMDLHRELNRLLTNVALESIDGARASGLLPVDRPLVRAFMAGLNDTAPLKFDHPGLGTTAARYGDRLSIQNDLGTTEGHIVVIRVDGFTATIIYSDIHRKRATFFQDLLRNFTIEWQATAAAAGGEQQLVVGRFTAAAPAALEELLRHLGSRLVFLIDWNRAQKQLARFVNKSDAVAILKWAADHDIGHRGFLQAGGARLISTAFERVAPSRLHYGAPLDELIGSAAAVAFLKAVLRIATSGLKNRRSDRLIEDEIEAELLPYLRTTERQILDVASEHAMLMSAIAEQMRRTLARSSTSRASGEIARTAALAKTWETRADAIVDETIRSTDGADSALSIRLVEHADDVIDALEEAAFLLTLLPDSAGHHGLVALRTLADLIGDATKEYVRCLEYAKEFPDSRKVIKDVLSTADHIAELERASDASERAAKGALMAACSDCRELHVLFEAVRAFEQAADALARCARVIRDYALRSMTGRA